ncbi:Crp/Fnr family transcriptional regulator [Novosphingobium album (ex Liu et al. 2023)]|uniref:Crp/Fnr family transcriptional regulator n=1 Tax=Novosphingobium album (ex Liu et al. 2023) TaxID=3031130 RepID=A0ABT5WUV7_9SPHN|nr:Crp/Fnr family transcriptional regulator [Novosphingobium album (ex Liu et al. 2023)]MDE8653685.1 Crp/Fnr family transcriptional regulator [Novosphingobium album (ex Liu et al. 2023)]
MHNLARSQPGYRDIAMPAGSGEILFLEGDPCDHVYELRRGIARGVNVSSEGDRQVTAFFFAGDQIGLPLSECYRFTAEAVTDVLYVRHSRVRWHEALIRSCREDGRLLPSICAEQDPIFRRGMIIGRNGVVVRVCAFLTSIVDRLPISADGAALLPLPQTDIAAYLATSPESVCRAFRQLREMHVIAMPRRDQIAITDRARLEAIASGIVTRLRMLHERRPTATADTAF